MISTREIIHFLYLSVNLQQVSFGNFLYIVNLFFNIALSISLVSTCMIYLHNNMSKKST